MVLSLSVGCCILQAAGAPHRPWRLCRPGCPPGCPPLLLSGRRRAPGAGEVVPEPKLSQHLPVPRDSLFSGELIVREVFNRHHPGGGLDCQPAAAMIKCLGGASEYIT